MSIQPEFDSIAEADAAYDAAIEGGGDDTPDSSDTGRWGDLQQKDVDWEGDWVLAYRAEQIQGSPGANPAMQWFVFRVNPQNGNFEALNMSGQADTYDPQSPPEELPHTSREQEARDAYQTWLDENDPGTQEEGDEGDQGEAWTEWTELNQVAGWAIWGRESQTSDAVQFLAATINGEDREVYLQPGGEIADTAHLFESQSDLQAALDAYQTRVDNGEVPEERQATGRSPSRGAITEATKTGTGSFGGPLSGLVDAVGGPTNAVLAVATIALVAYYLDAEGYVDLGLAEFVNDLGGKQA